MAKRRKITSATLDIVVEKGKGGEVGAKSEQGRLGQVFGPCPYVAYAYL